MAKKCKHLDQIKITTTDTHVCEECVKLGDTWVHLRMCMICGNVGCCDSSKNKHATKHFHHIGHPVMRSIEPGEDWIWCYVDEMIAGEVCRINTRSSRFAPARFSARKQLRAARPIPSIHAANPGWRS